MKIGKYIVDDEWVDNKKNIYEGIYGTEIWISEAFTTSFKPLYDYTTYCVLSNNEFFIQQFKELMYYNNFTSIQQAKDYVDEFFIKLNKLKWFL